MSSKQKVKVLHYSCLIEVISIVNFAKIGKFLSLTPMKKVGWLNSPKKTVTERAIPTQIFFADPETQRKYIYNWTKNDAFKHHVDIRDVLDWGYYQERLASQIQKMVCIPAVTQNLSNPIPDI